MMSNFGIRTKIQGRNGKKFIGIQWFLVKTLSQSDEKGVQLQLIKEIQVSCQMTTYGQN